MSDLQDKVDWARFVHYLELQSSRTDLSIEQLDTLEYLKAYSSYNRKIKKRVPVPLLNCFINTFVSDLKPAKKGAK